MLPGLGRAVDQERGQAGPGEGRQFLIIFNAFSVSLESLWKLSG